MPYKLFTKYQDGQKKWCTRNLRTGQVIHYSSPEKKETGIRMREAFSHGFRPKGLASASRHTRIRVARMGGRARRK